jgi:hypothetical protein
VPRRGVTFEVALGTGWQAGEQYSSDISEASSLLFGGSLGIGNWISPRLAYTVRAVATAGKEGEANVTNAFLGFTLQYWFDDHGWASGGIGPGASVLPDKQSEFGIEQGGIGVGFDLRAGYAIPIDAHASFHIFLEATPWYIKETWGTALTLMAGFQML